jgi:hypothetical protein
MKYPLRLSTAESQSERPSCSVQLRFAFVGYAAKASFCHGGGRSWNSEAKPPHAGLPAAFHRLPAASGFYYRPLGRGLAAE